MPTRWQTSPTSEKRNNPARTIRVNFKFPKTLGFLIAAGVFFAVFPPFRVVSLADKQAAEAEQQFQADEFAERFWSDQLIPILGSAAALEDVAAALANDAEAALETFGHRVGLSRKYHVMTAVTAEVVSVSETQIEFRSAALEGSSITVMAPPIFGNAVRDCSGLLDVNAFADSRQFNEVSAALNAVVEREILPRLFAVVESGAEVDLVGAFTLSQRRPSMETIELVPLQFRAP